jgi:DNA-binding NarL/FixJ family response regulator
MDGLKAASEIHRLMPSIPTVIHTLYQSALDLTTADKYGVRKVVDKTEVGSLFSTVKELLREEVQSQSGVPHETSET